MRQATAYQHGPKETPATLRDVISVKSALAALLIEEADYMDTMQIARVSALQERKLKLTSMLERYMRYLQQHPETVGNVSQADKTELTQVAARFGQACKRNYDTLLVARAVNNSVVKCVTQVVTRREQNPVYNAAGATKPHYRPVAISLTLNETV